VRRYPVEHAVDAFAARRSAMEMAEDLGFPRVEALELAIATSELAVNIAKYGVRGEVIIEVIDDPARGPGIAIVACDCGPPFQDFLLAQRDGFSDHGPIDPLYRMGRHGTGTGLGAVVRFTDELTYEPLENGKRIRAVRFLKRPPKPA
jgi:anti-sigma regulatory factor (Ser/Thr protein kinase)